MRKISTAFIVVAALLLAGVYFLEVYENYADSLTTHPEEWQKNYESYCNLKEVGFFNSGYHLHLEINVNSMNYLFSCRAMERGG